MCCSSVSEGEGVNKWDCHVRPLDMFDRSQDGGKRLPDGIMVGLCVGDPSNCNLDNLLGSGKIVAQFCVKRLIYAILCTSFCFVFLFCVCFFFVAVTTSYQQRDL